MHSAKVTLPPYTTASNEVTRAAILRALQERTWIVEAEEPNTIVASVSAGGHSATASVEMGVGSLTLRLPRSQGIQVNRSSFLTSFSAQQLERRGDSYFSDNWATAPHKLTIDVSAALGSIDIEWVD